jgi:hypothetical protein
MGIMPPGLPIIIASVGSGIAVGSIAIAVAVGSIAIAVGSIAIAVAVGSIAIAVGVFVGGGDVGVASSPQATATTISTTAMTPIRDHL